MTSNKLGGCCIFLDKNMNINGCQLWLEFEFNKPTSACCYKKNVSV